QIDHWAYFPSSTAAEQFSLWVQAQGYELDSVSAADDGRLCVRFFHDGSCQLSDITSHTIALRRKASDLGGDYDGWETPVCKTPTYRRSSFVSARPLAPSPRSARSGSAPSARVSAPRVQACRSPPPSGA